MSELVAETQRSGVAATISGSTIWRWLDTDAIRPWCHRSWLFPRDPAFEAKAGRILDLYARTWEGAPLTANEFVLSADEKTSIQARRRIHPTVPTRARHVMRVEHEYERAGAWAYLAAWDVHHAKLFGRCEATTGIAPFDRLVAQVMTVAPYRNAHRVFWIVDNGSSHRGARAIARLQQQYPNLVLVHGPVHASWLNQIEIAGNAPSTASKASGLPCGSSTCPCTPPGWINARSTSRSCNARSSRPTISLRSPTWNTGSSPLNATTNHWPAPSSGPSIDTTWLDS